MYVIQSLLPRKTLILRNNWKPNIALASIIMMTVFKPLTSTVFKILINYESIPVPLKIPGPGNTKADILFPNI